MSAKGEPQFNISRNDFIFIKSLGKGAFGKVWLMKERKNGECRAVKIINRREAMKEDRMESVTNEKKILMSTNCPFIVKLYYYFSDKMYIYFVLNLAAGGDLLYHLNRNGRFDERLSKFYAAQVLLAIEHLHQLNILYRDLKPENILMSTNGYIQLTDFGLSKEVTGRTYTLCGTPDYIAPEALLSKGYGKSVDYWAYGVLIYEFNYGDAPFTDSSDSLIYDNITFGTYNFPRDFSKDLKDLIKNLLQRDISKRYGVLKKGVDDIKSHKWFKNMMWSALEKKAIKAPYTPIVKEYKECKFGVNV